MSNYIHMSAMKSTCGILNKKLWYEFKSIEAIKLWRMLTCTPHTRRHKGSITGRDL